MLITYTWMVFSRLYMYMYVCHDHHQVVSYRSHRLYRLPLVWAISLHTTMVAQSVLWSTSMALSSSTGCTCIGIKVTDKKAMKLKPRDRRILPASLVSYTGTVLSLLWPNKFALIFCCKARANNGKRLWDSTSNRVWATATKGWQGQSRCISTLE